MALRGLKEDLSRLAAQTRGGACGIIGAVAFAAVWSFVFSYLVVAIFGPNPKWVLRLSVRSLFMKMGLSISQATLFSLAVVVENVLFHGILVFPFLLVLVMGYLKSIGRRTPGFFPPGQERKAEARCLFGLFITASLALQIVAEICSIAAYLIFGAMGGALGSPLIVWSGYDLPYVASFRSLLVLLGIEDAMNALGDLEDFICFRFWSGLARLSLLAAIASWISLVCFVTQKRFLRILGALTAILVLPVFVCIAFGTSWVVRPEGRGLALLPIVGWYIGVAVFVVVTWRVLRRVEYEGPGRCEHDER